MLYLILVIIFLIIFYNYKKHKYVIENGKIIFKNLDSNYNLEKLIKDLVKNKINNIDNIEKAYYFLGRLKFNYDKPQVVIFNGKIDYDSLLKIKKTPFLILKSLKSKTLKLDEILYAIYLNDKLYIVKY